MLARAHLHCSFHEKTCENVTKVAKMVTLVEKWSQNGHFSDKSGPRVVALVEKWSQNGHYLDESGPRMVTFGIKVVPVGSLLG